MAMPIKTMLHKGAMHTHKVVISGQLLFHYSIPLLQILDTPLASLKLLNSKITHQQDFSTGTIDTQALIVGQGPTSHFGFYGG